MGVAGSGKTFLKHCLFGEKPPSIRCSTALAEAAIRAISRAIVGTDLTGWFRVTYDQLMEMLGGALKVGVPMEKTEAVPSDTSDVVASELSPKMDNSVPNKSPKRSGDPVTASRDLPQNAVKFKSTPTTPSIPQVSSSK